ncbi:MAG: protein kinase [Chitinophaga sp.]|uniref:serine/threonine protein kinase n=1 Tax=Chitinophaga sp. TaxID=1869181 RepID=UPI0025B8C143|nr:protein kinase [Chitinophaga sp.]MBV8251866.1 protein kinase [Chitinophaga sp.]
MNVQVFTPNFLKHFGISGFYQQEKKGGQKMVYFPICNGEYVVLKHLHSGLGDRETREMEIYEKFKAINGIPKIIKIEQYGNETFIIEEYIEGNTLIDIANQYAGNGDSVKKLIWTIMDIMHPIWEAKYVHRDIKPENIIIRLDGTPVVIDFGIARDLEANSITGAGWQPKSWRFASPEQYQGDKDKISYRTDFFSLGILAYYLFHQYLPFGNNEQEISNKFKSKNESFITHKDFPLTNFCIEALKFSPAERPRKIKDLINLL